MVTIPAADNNLTWECFGHLLHGPLTTERQRMPKYLQALTVNEWSYFVIDSEAL